LDVRAHFTNSCLADLYDQLSMPPDLLSAHRNLDKAVMRAYGFSIKNTTEQEIVISLVKMHQSLVSIL
jgi:hypothetical protein